MQTPGEDGRKVGLYKFIIQFIRLLVKKDFCKVKIYIHILNSGEEKMDKLLNASDIKKGFHPEGYRIDKTASPIDFYTKWEITSEGQWINPKPSCFHSMPQEGWNKADSF